ncbi:hypothetical protein VP236O401_P0057 [Vibrio phage 236O40-1]|nr:hypothetical protein VP236O401_P0057 [Vibrio phage 236O40-1]
MIEYNGGICLDAADSIALGKYIIELESLAK